MSRPTKAMDMFIAAGLVAFTAAGLLLVAWVLGYLFGLWDAPSETSC